MSLCSRWCTRCQTRSSYFSVAILAEATLSFLGLGVPPPSPDWGTMIAEAQPYFDNQWWLAVLPGIAILLTGLGLSLVADGLAQKLDAR